MVGNADVCVTVRSTTMETTMKVVSNRTRNSCAVASDTLPPAAVSSTEEDEEAAKKVPLLLSDASKCVVVVVVIDVALPTATAVAV